MMMGQEDNRKLISREELLKLANELIKKDYDYLDGMRADEVEQKGDYLVFKGEFFFDDDGMPTPKTNAVFNMFKKLSVTLSHKYKL